MGGGGGGDQRVSSGTHAGGSNSQQFVMAQQLLRLYEYGQSYQYSSRRDSFIR